MNAQLQALLPKHVRTSEFDALLRLLDDTDETVCLAVRQKLKSYGGSIAPCLRLLLPKEKIEESGEILTEVLTEILIEGEQTILDSSLQGNEHIQDSLRLVMESFKQDALLELLDMIKESGDTGKDIDLEAAVILLSRFGYPETSDEAIKQRLDDIALRIHALFIKSPQRSELNLLLSVNQAFFEEEQFYGAMDEQYHESDNSYIFAVLKNKRGIPISLCALYLLVAERAGVNLHGVGMPAHFIVYHPELDIFIDTFNKGAFLSHEDCKRFINGTGFHFEPSMLDRVSNTAILLRMIRNLIFAYTRHFNNWEVAALQEISSAIVETMNQEES
jgi:regulator of sirC expression with transglutaminase-like and TPR domain